MIHTSSTVRKLLWALVPGKSPAGFKIQKWNIQADVSNTCVRIHPESSLQSSGMPISTMPHCALTPPLRPSGLWMVWQEIRSASGIRWLLTLSYLSVFVPPPLGAFVLANHQSYEDFKSTPASAAHSSPIFSVQQNIQFPLLQVFSNQDELLSLARLSASEGYLSEEVIPFLGHSNQESSLGASLPLAPPVKRSRCLPFFLHSRLSTEPSQRRSSRRRYQGCRPADLRSRRFGLFAGLALSQASQF